MNLMTVDDLANNVDILSLFKDADKMRLITAQARHHDHDADFSLRGGARRVMATVFLEPSLRTRLSFESAMTYLGGRVISAPGPDSTSAAKGESIADTMRTVCYYADLVVVRASVPHTDWYGSGLGYRAHIINAGDGPCNHPTQALLDLYTIWRHDGSTGELFRPKTIGIVGDLGKSRAIRSFFQLMRRGQYNKFILYDSKGSEALLDGTPRDAKDVTYCMSASDFEERLREIDVLYLNRVQWERHSDNDNTWRPFIFTKSQLDRLNERAIVLNPGPRKEELPHPLDNYNQVRMWDQVENGLYVRMAIIRHMFKYPRP